jgi:ABC-type multidrug transport system fused ATPase/permease subunit
MARASRSKTEKSGVRFQGGIDSTDAEGSSITYFDVLKRLPAYLSEVKKWMALGGVGVIINSATSVITPLAVALATNNMISGNVSLLTWAAIGYIVLTLINWAGQYMQISFLTFAGQRTLYKMRTQLFDHLQLLPLSFYDNNKVGKIMSRVQNDVGQLQSLVSQDIITLMANVLTLLTIAAIMLVMNVKLGLLTLTFVPVLIIVVLFWQKRAREAFMNARQTIATVNDKIQEGVSGVRVSQSMSREGVNLQEFEAVNKSNYEANMRATKLHAFMWPIMDILTSAAYAMVLVYGGFQVLNKTMEVGTLLAFLLYVQKFVGPVTRITQQYTDIQNTLASGVRIFELMDIEPQIKDSPAAIEMPVIKGEIDFQNVTFSYEDNDDVLKEINLKIAAGETVAIAGQTGAG